MIKKFNLSKERFDNILKELNILDKRESDVKEFIKKLKENGEVLKNGAFIINYKKFKELAGDDLI